MDFITHLLTTTSWYDYITTFVDRFSKRVHLAPSKGTDTATDVADCFLDQVFCLHGLPNSIVSDRDPKFTSKLWSHLIHRFDIKLKMLTSRHSQTDSVTDLMNWMLGVCLWCYWAFLQRDWDQLLTAVELHCSSSLVEPLRMTPFQADLGWLPESPLQFLGSSNESVKSVDDFQKLPQASFHNATFAQWFAQASQSAYNAKRYASSS